MYTPLRGSEGLVPKYERGLGAAGGTWWPWGRKRRSTGYHPPSASYSTTEEKKLVFTKDIFSSLMWHLSTIISCLATGVILYLNFSEHSIGTEIGRNEQETRNILGALQLAAKAHEIVIIISLGRIARQWIQQCLLSDGLLLGLMGAESSLSNLALLVSREFRVAIRCAVTALRAQAKGKHAQVQPRQAKALILLLGLLSIGCLLCSLAGPASAVLMIPHHDWFHEVDIFSGSEYYAHTDNPDILAEFPGIEQFANYPNIFTALEPDEWDSGIQSTFFDVPSYWEEALIARKPTTYSRLEYYVGISQVRIDVNTLLDRELVTEASWKGATKLTSVIIMENSRNLLRLSGYEPSPKSRGSEVKYVAEVTGIEVNTVCRRQQKKQSCSLANVSIENSSEWCFTSVIENSPSGLPLSSKNLLLVYAEEEDTDVRIWMTGGRTDSKDKFSDSIVIVIEEVLGTGFPDLSLIVCSISAIFKSVTASSTTHLFSPDELHFHEHMSYFDGSSTRYDAPRKLLYHDSWFEYIHGQGSKISDPCYYTSNKTYPCHGKLEQTRNNDLSDWGEAIACSDGYSFKGTWWKQSGKAIGAETAETIVGGTFLSALVQMNPSVSQYGDYFGTGPLSPLKELMVDPTRDYTQYLAPPVKVYRRIYGFRLSSRTSILSVVVLLLHAVLVLIGSLWQFRRGILIQAWGSMPEYVTLFLGSDTSHGVENTCAGIGQDETLNKIVRIREVTDAHLELMILSSNTKSLGSVVDSEKNAK